MSKKCTLWYDDKSTQYRSSIAVERELRKRRFVPASDEEATGIETGGETTSEYDPYSSKTPRMMELGSILSCSVRCSSYALFISFRLHQAHTIRCTYSISLLPGL